MKRPGFPAYFPAKRLDFPAKRAGAFGRRGGVRYAHPGAVEGSAAERATSKEESVMSSLRDQLSRRVYSTDQGDLRGRNEEGSSQARDRARLEALDGIVRIKRETAGRKGKGVTTVHGVPLEEKALKTLAQALKKRCGSGGALKEGVIEIQGDHREVLRAELEKRGFSVRLAGG